MTGSRKRRARGVPQFARPLREFVRTEAAGGVLLLAATAAALLWANLAGTSYGQVWSRHVDVLVVDEPLRAWVNDALMALFFYVIGLEIKRELFEGELADPRRAALPVAAAIGGMAAPALIYAAFNATGDGARGWGIPMATDIAFAVGVLALAGPRVPPPLKIFLLALAIVDDIGAIAVIAIFYTSGIELGWLALAAGGVIAAFALRWRGPRWTLALIPLGILTWYAAHRAGVHPTIAGVAMGLATPLAAAAASGRPGRRVLDDLEHRLHPWTSFGILPVFALANAGVPLDLASLRDASHSPVAAGVTLGLLAGKPLGIVLAAFMATRLRIATLPRGVSWPQLTAAAVVAGIGFTVSLFVTTLAFPEPALVDDARIGVFAASAVAALAGYVALRITCRAPRRPRRAGNERR